VTNELPDGSRIRAAAETVAGIFALRECGVRIRRQAELDTTSGPRVGRRDLFDHVEVETSGGRRLVITVMASADGPERVPAWLVPSSFGDALANPDCGRWVALVQLMPTAAVMHLAPEHAIRRIVMQRHLLNAHSAPREAIEDAAVALDYGYDLASVRGLFVGLEDLLESAQPDVPPTPTSALSPRE